MDPYRAPQRLPPPPPDAMRPVLIGAGVVAGLIAVAAMGVYVVERMEQRKLTATREPKVERAKISDGPQPSVEARPPRKYDIAQGVVIDTAMSDDAGARHWSKPIELSFAIFPAGLDKRAITIFKTEHGHHDVELLSGSYDFCWGGSADPICARDVDGGEIITESCPSNALDCSCRPPSQRRIAWRIGCERVRVADSVTHVTASVGIAGFSPVFVCEPADACAKADVNPDAARR